MAIYIILSNFNFGQLTLKSLSAELSTFNSIISNFYFTAHFIVYIIMKGSHSTSDNLTDVMLNPHPPNAPGHNKNEALLKSRQRRYIHQKNDNSNFENREIKSAGSNTDTLYSNQKQDRIVYKSKISSAPSPRSRVCSDYRSNIIQREESSGLYTFNSIPSFVPDINDNANTRRTKRKENSVSSNATISISNSKNVSLEPNYPSLVIHKSLKPCISEASPVTSIPCPRLIYRRSLHEVSKEKLVSRKSMQSSLDHSKKLETLVDIAIKNSVEMQNTEPINLTQYRLANDLSDSFENKILASLVAQNSHEPNVNSNTPMILPQILNSKDFTKITPRTEALLMCGSYSDEESSATNTGPYSNKTNFLNVGSGRYDMHNEWKSRITCSQDTAKSTDFITDSCCNSTLVDDGNGNNNNNNNNTSHRSSRYQDYLLVHYIPDFDCFYDPETGIFYESAF